MGFHEAMEDMDYFDGWNDPDEMSYQLDQQNDNHQIRCPGCDTDPVGYAPHNGEGDCATAHAAGSRDV